MDATSDPVVIFRDPRRAKLGLNGAPLYGDTVIIRLEPIFTPEEASRLRAAMARNRRGASAKELRQSYPLTGRIHSLCSSHFTGHRGQEPSDRVYRCSGKTERYAKGPICSCSCIHADSVEQLIWREVCDLLGDSDRLRIMAADWAGLAGGEDVDFEQRLADVERQIEAQDAAIAAVMVVAAKRENPANAIANATSTLNEEREQLLLIRSNVLARQAEAASADRRVEDFEALAQLTRKRLRGMRPEQQREVLELLDVRVTVAGPVPRVRKADCLVTQWFRQQGRRVPVLTDAAWAKIEPVLTASHRRRRVDRLPDRVVMEAILHKARTGQAWTTPGYQARFHSWRASGVWEEAMRLLSDAEGTPIPPQGAVPPLQVEGRVDPKLLLGVGSTPQNTVATGNGMASSEAYPCSPCTVSALGCTGTIRLP
ncbi:transposase [Streptomyces violascens]|uniref:transposase n=1 Tax=Streptomyces violascens TaxID=67381 RepID=UPI003664E49B